jgi:hypothetical protein
MHHLCALVHTRLVFGILTRRKREQLETTAICFGCQAIYLLGVEFRMGFGQLYCPMCSLHFDIYYIRCQGKFFFNLRLVSEKNFEHFPHFLRDLKFT